MSAARVNRKRSLIDLFQRTNLPAEAAVPQPPPPVSTIDQLLHEAGSFGLYQKLQFLLVGLLAVLPAMTAFSYVFIAATPDHRCQVHPPNLTDTFDIQSELHHSYVRRYIPATLNDPKCYMYPENTTGQSPVRCTAWVFNTTFYNTTISTEWNLVCNRLHWKAITQNAYIIGTSGSLLSGIMSDKLGRRTTMYSLILLMVIVLNGTQFIMHSNISTTKKLVVFTVSRLLTGFAQTTYSITLVLLLEMTSAKRRVLASNILSYFYTMGMSCMPSRTSVFHRSP